MSTATIARDTLINVCAQKQMSELKQCCYNCLKRHTHTSAGHDVFIQDISLWTFAAEPAKQVYAGVAAYVLRALVSVVACLVVSSQDKPFPAGTLVTLSLIHI